MNSINVGLETTRTTIDTNTTVYASGNNKIRFDDATRLLYLTGEITVSLLCIFGNALVLEAIRRHRNLHTPTNVFIFNLAVSDLFVGLLVVPAELIFNGGITLNLTFNECLLVNCMILVVYYSTILMLLVVACERFIATRFPFFYFRKVDISTARVITCVVWLTSSFLGMIPMMGWNVGPRSFQHNHGGHCYFHSVFTPPFIAYFQFISMFVVPLLIMSFVYAYIGLVVHRHHSYITRIHARFNIKKKRDLKTTKIVAVVITAFVCFFFPLNILRFMYHIGNGAFCVHTGEEPSDGKLCRFPRDWSFVTLWLSHVHSLANPVIYAVGNSNVKVAMKNVLFHQSEPLPMSLMPDGRKLTMASGTSRQMTAMIRHIDSTTRTIITEGLANILDDQHPSIERQVES